MTVFHFLPREMKLAPFPLLAKKKLPKGIEIVDGIFWLHVKEWILLHGEIIVTSHFPFLIFFNYDIIAVEFFFSGSSSDQSSFYGGLLGSSSSSTSNGRRPSNSNPMNKINKVNDQLSRFSSLVLP